MMRIEITDRADAQVQATAEYIKEEFGRRAEQKFKAKFREVIRLLATNPYLGPIEPLLADLPLQRNKITVLRGPMYSTASGASFTVSTNWIGDTNFVDF